MKRIKKFYNDYDALIQTTAFGMAIGAVVGVGVYFKVTKYLGYALVRPVVVDEEGHVAFLTLGNRLLDPKVNGMYVDSQLES